MPTFIAGRLLPAMTRTMDTAVRHGQAVPLKSETTAGVPAAEPDYLSHGRVRAEGPGSAKTCYPA